MGDFAIASAIRPDGADTASGFSLLFARGYRPGAEGVAALAAREGGSFAMSYVSPRAEGRAELLVSGLTFDLTGLAPAPPTVTPSQRHAFGLDGPELPADLEAIRLTPGQPLAGGGALLPVVSAMAGLAASLTGIDGVRAVCWHPAATCIETALFVRLVETWRSGGAFPALGLTALVREADGGIRSEGLAFFIGQELRLEPAAGEKPTEATALAGRLVHRLVEDGPVHSVCELVVSDGAQLDVDPSLDGGVLRMWRRNPRPIRP